MTQGLPWRTDGDGIVLSVKVTPRGRLACVGGLAPLADGAHALKVVVREAPSDGVANEAVLLALAKALHVRPQQISLVSGHAARLKRVRVGPPLPGVAERLAELSAAEAPSARRQRTGTAG